MKNKNNSMWSVGEESALEKRKYIKVNLMRVYLSESRREDVLELIQAEGIDKLGSVRRTFSKDQLTQMALELPRWLAWVTGKRTHRSYQGPSEILRALEHRLVNLPVAHWFALILIVTESRAKPTYSR
jgi:hypothetical protein